MEKRMNKLYDKLTALYVKLVNDERGQDMVEYALLAGFIAVAAGAILPGISGNISIIFSRMGSVVAEAAS
jgi:pilus assembly protein Flp/PilA